MWSYRRITCLSLHFSHSNLWVTLFFSFSWCYLIAMLCYDLHFKRFYKLKILVNLSSPVEFCRSIPDFVDIFKVCLNAKRTHPAVADASVNMDTTITTNLVTLNHAVTTIVKKRMNKAKLEERRRITAFSLRLLYALMTLTTIELSSSICDQSSSFYIVVDSIALLVRLSPVKLNPL